MNNSVRLAVGLIAVFPLVLSAGLVVEGITCEYLPGTVYTDVAVPRLGWTLRPDDRGPQQQARGQKQTAYRIFVASSEAGLRRARGDLWDTGKVASEQSVQVRYQGVPLQSRQQCFWKVQVWDRDDRPSEWSGCGIFEMGLLSRADWEPAVWIGLGSDSRQSPYSRRLVRTSAMSFSEEAETFPSPLFRREFELRSRIVRARTYICGLGYHELYINGKRVGDQVLDPGQTTYDVRAFYVVHDITRHLNPGRNVIGIWLGNGFYGQNIAFAAKSLAWGPPVVICRTTVDYSDGACETIVTDESWRAETGPVLFDNVYAGETYDARRERTGWNRPGFNDFNWQKAARVDGPTSNLVVQNVQPMMRQWPRLWPKKVMAGRDGRWIFDLRQNMAGWVRIRVNEPPGTRITMRFAELLTPDGTELDVLSTGPGVTGVEQVCMYICKGSGWEEWEPRFAYQGFRYVEVAGLTRQPPPDLLEGVPIRSAVERSGDFKCSNEVLNRMYQVSLRTLESNLHSVPEDCPHREKCAWLGNAHGIAETSIYNFHMPGFWAKFMDDVDTVLGRGGETYDKKPATPGIPCNIGVGRRLCQEARPDQGAAIVFIPWYMYLFYGDTEVFARHYESMKRFVEYVDALAREGIVCQGYGDGPPPGDGDMLEAPVELTATACHYRTLVLMDRVAGCLGRSEDAGRFWVMAQKTKEAFNRKFLDRNRSSYGSLAANVVALRYGLVPDGRDADVAKALYEDVVERQKGRIRAGVDGLWSIYSLLCRYGYDEAAVAALTSPDFPSHADALARGATTWPERFAESTGSGSASSGSQNHPLQSAFAAWFHESVAGIRPMDDVTGFRRVELEPHCFRQLCWASAWYASPYGYTASSWSNNAGRLEWRVTVPPNTTAVLHVPAGEPARIEENGVEAERSSGVKFIRQEKGRVVYEVDSGTYCFKSVL